MTDRKYIIWKLEKVSSTYCSLEHKHGKDRPANDIVHPRVTQAKSKIGFVDLAALQKNFPILPFPFLPQTTQKIFEQTWNLSKILHTQIFRLKVLHRKST